jgi:hypothetical protein
MLLNVLQENKNKGIVKQKLNILQNYQESQ